MATMLLLCAVAPAQAPPQFLLEAPSPIAALNLQRTVTADVDGDGDLDVLGTGYFGWSYHALYLLRNDGNGQFTDVTTAQMPGFLQPIYDVTPFDCDGDGDVGAGGVEIVKHGGHAGQVGHGADVHRLGQGHQVAHVGLAAIVPHDAGGDGVQLEPSVPRQDRRGVGLEARRAVRVRHPPTDDAHRDEPARHRQARRQRRARPPCPSGTRPSPDRPPRWPAGWGQPPASAATTTRER
jgi:hypothetical protein